MLSKQDVVSGASMGLQGGLQGGLDDHQSILASQLASILPSPAVCVDADNTCNKGNALASNRRGSIKVHGDRIASVLADLPDLPGPVCHTPGGSYRVSPGLQYQAKQCGELRRVRVQACGVSKEYAHT